MFNSKLAGFGGQPGGGSDLMRLRPPMAPMNPISPVAPRSTMPQPTTGGFGQSQPGGGGSDAVPYAGGGQSLTVPASANPFDRLGAASPVATSWNRTSRYFQL